MIFKEMEARRDGKNSLKYIFNFMLYKQIIIRCFRAPKICLVFGRNCKESKTGALKTDRKLSFVLCCSTI
jgi:hypothetical protein